MKEPKKKVSNGKSNTNQYQLLLLDDNVNSFDDVIDILIDMCGYTLYQAEQCALIVNNNGEVVIRTGTKSAITKLHKTLTTEGLTVKIQQEA